MKHTKRLLIITIITLLLTTACTANKSAKDQSTQPSGSASVNTASQPKTEEDAAHTYDEPEEENQESDLTKRTKERITIENNTFKPSTVQVIAGSTISWHNEDQAEHLIKFQDQPFDTGAIPHEAEKTLIFDTPGTYTFYSSTNPNVTGKIIVEKDVKETN